MGKNKLAKFSEMERFENVIQVPYKKLQHENFYLIGMWATEFFKNENPVILELGCGKGEYTVKLAEKNPEINYIGVDIKGARM
ncbi:MAG: methyltransferase domain-containing protein, partial [Bacteroidales bacterium]|nr:methyltransferase domain-containing protein [Bacteroidales bacterium]